MHFYLRLICVASVLMCVAAIFCSDVPQSADEPVTTGKKMLHDPLRFEVLCNDMRN